MRRKFTQFLLATFCWPEPFKFVYSHSCVFFLNIIAKCQIQIRKQKRRIKQAKYFFVLVKKLCQLFE